MTKNPYYAYHKATHTVSKTKQVVMLYDGVIRNLQQARAAMEDKRIEDRFNQLVRASEIIMGLQSCLDFDQGVEAAQILFDFYSSVDLRIAGLHRSNDVVACAQLIDELKDMRHMWDRFDRGEGEAATDVSKGAEMVYSSTDADAQHDGSSDQGVVLVPGSVTLSA